MQKGLFILIIFFTFQSTLLAESFSINKTSFLENFQDTIVDANKENEVINEVLKSGTAPDQYKVQYFSEVTKYGFKDLFKNFSYNSSVPYSQQVNPYAESYMQDYLHAHGNYLRKMKSSSVLYFNLIDNVLTQYGLPKELKYLAVIESNLNSQATSWVGARGPWQFMSYTAKQFGLKVDGYNDERTDYYKSTDAAARYLLSLYKDLKDWLLVIAAYNGGPGRVYSAIQKSGSRNFWNLQYYLPLESRNHVKKFIATHYVMETDNPGNDFDYSTLNSTNGFSPGKNNLTKEDSINTRALNISGRFNAMIIAKNLSIDIAEFNRLNPGFDNTISAGQNYNLRLPADKMDLFITKKYVILNECVQALLTDLNETPKTGHASPQKNNAGKLK